MAFLYPVVLDPGRQGLLGAHHHHQFLAPGDRGIDQISLQQEIVLHQDGDDNGWIFGALRFVHGYRIGENNLVQIAMFVKDIPALEGDGEFLSAKRKGPRSPV